MLSSLSARRPVFTARSRIFFGVCSMSINSRTCTLRICGQDLLRRRERQHDQTDRPRRKNLAAAGTHGLGHPAGAREPGRGRRVVARSGRPSRKRIQRGLLDAQHAVKRGRGSLCRDHEFPLRTLHF